MVFLQRCSLFACSFPQQVIERVLCVFSLVSLALRFSFPSPFVQPLPNFSFLRLFLSYPPVLSVSIVKNVEVKNK